MQLVLELLHHFPNFGQLYPFVSFQGYQGHAITQEYQKYIIHVNASKEQYHT